MLNMFQYLSFSQNPNLDSVIYFLKKKPMDTTTIKKLNELNSKVIFRGQLDTGIYLQRIILKEAIKLNFLKGQGKANNLIGVAFYYYGEADSALKYYKNALVINTKANYRKGIGAAHDNIAMILSSKGNYVEALDHQFIALAIQEEIDEKEGIALSYNGIAQSYSNLRNFKEAINYFEKTLKIANTYKTNTNISNLYSHMGICYSQMKDLKNAVYCYRIAMREALIMKNNDGLIYIYNNIGGVYIEHNYPDSAVKYFGLAKDLINFTNNREAIATTCVNYGSLLISQNKLNEAEPYFIKALGILKELGIKKGFAEAYGSLGEIAYAKKEYKKAFDYLKLCMQCKDSMLNENIQKKIGDVQMLYEREKKNKEIVLLQKDKEMQTSLGAAEKKKKNIILMSGILIVVLLGIFIGFIVNRFNLTKKQKNIIEEQKHLVEEKQKEIIDSIAYAKRLQDAIIPSVALIQQHLPDSFVLYKPKDIVAGDFYWMEIVKDEILIAAADCTGHGVPGAMVSVVCSNALNRAVKEFGLTDPGKILDKVRELVLETFEKSVSEVKDGMDISFCSINIKTKKIKWAGAYNPLWYIENNELKEVVANKQPIGKNDNPAPFTTHNLEFKDGAILFLFTDGYPDQFGGPKGKKYKYKQLEDLLVTIAAKPLTEQASILDEKFESWRGELEQVDDVTIIGIRL